MSNQGVREKYIEMIKKGMTEEEIGDEYGVTRQEISRSRVKFFSGVYHDLVSTRQAIKIIGIDKSRLERIAGVLNIYPIHSSPGRKLWSKDSINVIDFIIKLCRVCRRCGSLLAPEEKGYVCVKCKKEYRRKGPQIIIRNV